MKMPDLFKPFKARKLLKQGREAEEKKDYETAFTLYEAAAQAGSAEAMTAIGFLYMLKGFRKVKTSNLMELLAQGMPIMPWSLTEKEVPDMKSALAWFRKAADAGNVQGMVMTGSILCDGKGCKADPDAGLPYLERAVRMGDASARNVLALYSKPRRAEVPDKRYEGWLSAFAAAVDAKDPAQFDLYARLKTGSDAQFARLGYVLTAARNICKPGYETYKYLFTEEGLPLIPAAAKRGAWQTFVHIDLNAFAGSDTLIAFTADIDPSCLLDLRHRLREVGTAVYRSPSFGWLGVEKKAVVFRIDREALLPPPLLQQAVQDFLLIDVEYQPENAAFFTERGEKEYSAEVAAIHGGKVDVLFRYTIGGSEHINQLVQPELVSLTLDE